MRKDRPFALSEHSFPALHQNMRLLQDNAIKKRLREVPVVAILSVALLLSGCSGTLGGSVENLLRATQLSGETSAVQRALSATLSSPVTFKYPASGDFLSPFLFGDWDGDGTQEAAALYTTADAANASFAVLEPEGEDSWRVEQTVEGLSGEVESVTTAHLRDAASLQVLVGYGSAQGDRYMVVYDYSDSFLQTVLTQTYTDMLLTNITGKQDTQDLVLALPGEGEYAGINLQLLTNTTEGFRNAQTLKIGEGIFTACTALHAGSWRDMPYLVVDGWSGPAATSLLSSFVTYNSETGFLDTYLPDGLFDPYADTLRYDISLTSRDLDENGTVDIPVEISDGGTISDALGRSVQFLLWRDFATPTGGVTIFGVYDSENGFFFSLPRSLRGKVRVIANASQNGWLLLGERGGTYCELRLIDPGDTPADARYQRVATIGARQLQARVFNEYPGLRATDIPQRIFLLQD